MKRTLFLFGGKEQISFQLRRRRKQRTGWVWRNEICSVEGGGGGRKCDLMRCSRVCEREKYPRDFSIFELSTRTHSESLFHDCCCCSRLCCMLFVRFLLPPRRPQGAQQSTARFHTRREKEVFIPLRCRWWDRQNKFFELWVSFLNFLRQCWRRSAIVMCSNGTSDEEEKTKKKWSEAINEQKWGLEIEEFVSSFNRERPRLMRVKSMTFCCVVRGAWKNWNIIESYNTEPYAFVWEMQMRVNGKTIFITLKNQTFDDFQPAEFVDFSLTLNVVRERSTLCGWVSTFMVQKGEGNDIVNDLITTRNIHFSPYTHSVRDW